MAEIDQRVREHLASEVVEEEVVDVSEDVETADADDVPISLTE